MSSSAGFDSVVSAGRRRRNRRRRPIRRGSSRRVSRTLLFALLLAIGGASFSWQVDIVRASPSGVTLSLVSAQADADGSGLDVSIEVVNPGEAFSGWVEIEGDQRRVLRAVEVPAGAATLDFLTYHVDYRGSLRVRLLDSEEAPLSTWSNASIEYATNALVVGASGSDFADFLSRTVGRLKVDQASELPPTAPDIEAYDFIVLASSTAGELGGADEALRAWVTGGGRLVVVAPSSLPAVAAEVFPGARFGDQRTLDAPAELVTAGRGAMLPPGAFVLAARTVIAPVETDGAPYSAALEDGTAVLVSAPFGRGTVLLLGLPLSGMIRDEAGAPPSFFWESVVFADPFTSSNLGMPAIDPPHTFVTGRVPSLLWTVLGAVVYTLGVGVGLFVLLRRLGHRDAVWWVVPAVVLVATLAVLATGLWARGSSPEVLTRRTVSADAATGLRTVGMEVGVYAPFGAEYRLDLGVDLLPGPLESTSGLFERPYTIRDRNAVGGGVGYEQVSVAPGAGRSVSMWADTEVVRGTSATAPFLLTKVEEGEGTRWTVTNAGAAPLRRLALVGNGIYTLPDLSPGASASFLVGSGPVAGEGVVVLAEEPPRPDSRDYLLWEAQARLWAEWRSNGPWMEGGAMGTEVAPPPAIEIKPSPLDPSSRSPIRLLAFAEEADAGPEVIGLPSRTERRGVVVYQVTLR